MADLNKLNSSLFDEISDLLEQPKSMSTKTAMTVQMKLLAAVWQSQNELIDHVREQNGRVKKNEKDIGDLKQNNIMMWVKANRGKAFFVFVGIFAVNSIINWQGIRKPLIHAALHALGLDVPIELIP